MDLATLIPLVLKVSIVLTVFAVGLGARAQDAVSLLTRPSLLARSLILMYVVMPLVAAGLAAAFDFPRSVEIALVALAVSPVPPLLPRKGLEAGGGASYTFGLLVAASLLAIVFVPAALAVLGPAFGQSVHMSPLSIARLVGMTVLVPLAVGIGVGRVAPALAPRLARVIGRVAMLTLVASALPVLVKAGPAMASLIGNGTLMAFMAFVLVGLVVGDRLGGPDPENRTVLALFTASRHPGVALAIAAANFPEEKLEGAAVILYLLVGLVASGIYLVWRRRRSQVAVGA